MAEFTAAVENYDRFMGRYATGLAPKFADAAGVRAGMRVLDVGCGPGALAVELAGRVGEDNVAAITPPPSSPLPARRASRARTCANGTSIGWPGAHHRTLIFRQSFPVGTTVAGSTISTTVRPRACGRCTTPRGIVTP